MNLRPKIANKRKSQKDLEVDLMLGKDHQLALIVMTDRKNRVAQLIKTTTKNSKIIADKNIERMNREKRKLDTITFDIGLEFAKHGKIIRNKNVFYSSIFFTG